MTSATPSNNVWLKSNLYSIYESRQKVNVFCGSIALKMSSSRRCKDSFRFQKGIRKFSLWCPRSSNRSNLVISGCCFAECGRQRNVKRLTTHVKFYCSSSCRCRCRRRLLKLSNYQSYQPARIRSYYSWHLQLLEGMQIGQTIVSVVSLTVVFFIMVWLWFSQDRSRCISWTGLQSTARETVNV